MAKAYIYIRNWTGCKGAKELLSQHESNANIIDVRKEPVSAERAQEILVEVTTLHAKIGRNLKTFDLRKEALNEADFKKAILGRSGTMRAPVIVKGKIMVAGFDEELWLKLI
jgi:arsenate reductase-like glutaredoxin family protein